MKRVFCILGSGLLIGTWTASFLSIHRQAIVLIACLVLSLILFRIFKPTQRSSVFALLLCLCLGSGLFYAKTILLYQPVIALENQTISTTAQVHSVKQRENGRYTYSMKTKDSSPNFSFLLYTDKKLSLTLGDTVTGDFLFHRPDSTALFDSEQYYRSQNIFLTAVPTKDTTIKVERPKTTPWYFAPAYMQSYLSARFDAHLSKDTSATLKAILLGDDSDVSYATEQAYRDAGVIHLFSVSGLHISILAGALLLLFAKIPLRIRIFLILGFVGCYLLIGGVQVSALRSALMLSLLLFGQLFRRRADSLNSLFFAGFVIVLFDVYAIMDIGFCMSFLATFGILVFAPKLQTTLLHRFAPKSNLTSKVLAVFSLSMSVFLSLLPLSVLSLKTLSLVAPFGNLVLSVLEIPVMLLGFLGALLSPLSSVPLLFDLLEFFISLLNQLTVLLASLFPLVLGLEHSIYTLWLFVSMVVLFGRALWHRKWSVHIAQICICVVLFLGCHIYVTIAELHTPTLYLVGNGTATNLVVTSSAGTHVISATDSTSADRQTVQFLKQKGIHHIRSLTLLYDSFDDYRDTLDLLSVYPNTTVFYPEQNTNVEDILLKQNPNLTLSPLTKQTRVLGTKEISITAQTSSISTLDIMLGDVPISVGRAQSLTKSNSAVLLLSNQPPKDPLPEYAVKILLSSPYQTQTNTTHYLHAYDELIQIRLKSDGALSITHSNKS